MRCGEYKRDGCTKLYGALDDLSRRGKLKAHVYASGKRCIPGRLLHALLKAMPNRGRDEREQILHKPPAFDRGKRCAVPYGAEGELSIFGGDGVRKQGIAAMVVARDVQPKGAEHLD